MLNQIANGVEPVWAEKHDGEVACDPIKSRQTGPKRPHIPALETKPWQMRPLNLASSRDLIAARINTEDLPGGADLLSNVQRRNPIPRGHVQDSGARKKIEMVQ